MSNVLLIADTPWVVNEVRSALAVGDWEIDELTEPAQAAAAAAGVDAVIVDMQVASMGGMAVIRDIRQSTDGVRRPRLVLLMDRSADAFLARRAGADAAVLKPIAASELRNALDPGTATEEE